MYGLAVVTTHWNNKFKPLPSKQGGGGAQERRTHLREMITFHLHAPQLLMHEGKNSYDHKLKSIVLTKNIF